MKDVYLDMDLFDYIHDKVNQRVAIELIMYYYI